MSRATNRKRKREDPVLDIHIPVEGLVEDLIEQPVTGVTEEFLEECVDNFHQDPTNVIIRNAVVQVGSLLAATDSEEARNINHVFLNTCKRKDVKATNQGYSGRCWLFAGLNIFRHAIMAALRLENFEFSEVYLFFWDKFERSNSFIQWFIDNPVEDLDDRYLEWMIDHFMDDGGWWCFFANLVNKYGVVPKTAMKETYQSDCSEDMNQNLLKIIRATVCYIHKMRNRLNEEGLQNIKEGALKQVFNLLVKYLGEPPKTFDWNFSNEDYEAAAISGLTPAAFTQMTLPNINFHDFVVLSNAPTGVCKFYQKYEINLPHSVVGERPNTFINLPIYELKKYAKKSILNQMPVWFAADVNKGFNPYESAFDENLVKTDLLFGETHSFDKGDRIRFRDIEGNHAMVLTGINVDEKERPTSWQVENSWGYYDYETPGLDGFLYMSDEWFEKYIIQVVIHRKFLSRTIQKVIDQEAEVIQPWDCMAPALFIKGVSPPKKLWEKASKRRRIN